MVLLLVTRARKFEIKRDPEHFHEALNLGAVIFVIVHLLRRVIVDYHNNLRKE